MATQIEFSGPLVAPQTAIVRAKTAGTLLSLAVAEGDADAAPGAASATNYRLTFHSTGGAVLLQSLVLGVVHVSVSTLVDGALVTVAGALSVWLGDRPGWLRLQRWALGSAFGALAIWLAMTPRHPST